MTFQVRVQRIVQETPEVRSFKLAAVADVPLPPFQAGAHIDIHLPGGLVRQYSLCNGPTEKDAYFIAVKREQSSRGGSAAMHDLIREGDLLAISEPRNNFLLSSSAKHHLLLAAGVGITPLLSMARHLVMLGATFELHYFARSSELAAFKSSLEDPAYTGRVHLHLGLEPLEVQSRLQTIVSERRPGAHLYLCGPAPFMNAVRRCASSSWPADSLHFEYFVADEATLSAPKEAFTVRLANRGGEYEIPSDQSIVQVLAGHGIEVFTSCEQGVCGSCVTGVLEGTPDHRDTYLSDHEKSCGDKMALCVSRSRTQMLVIDL